MWRSVGLAVVLLVLSADYAAAGFISNTGKARRLYNPRYSVQQNGDGIGFSRHRRALRKKKKKKSKYSGPAYLYNAETLIKPCKGRFTAADEGKCCDYDNGSPIITCENFPRGRVFKKCDGSFQCCEGVTGACAGKRENATCHNFRTRRSGPTDLFFLGFKDGVCMKSGCESYCDTPLEGDVEDARFWLLVTALILVAVAILAVYFFKKKGLFCFKEEKNKIAQEPDEQTQDGLSVKLQTNTQCVQVQAQPVVVQAVQPQPVAVSQPEPVVVVAAKPV